MHASLNPNPTPGHQAHNLRVAMVVAQWHPEITESLRSAATDVFLEAGGNPEHLLTIGVPGAWELSSACGRLVHTLEPPPDAILAIGCVIKGETQHDRWINHGICAALATLGAQSGIPITLGVLTCDTHQQAQDRAGGIKGNKGADAMSAAIGAVHSLRNIHWSSCP